MGVSKVVYGNDTLVDLTGDTVTPTSLTLGATAHGADGEPIVGEYQYVLPPMSSDIRGGARIQPDSGLEITDTDNLQVRLALESDGTVRGGIAELQAKGHAEQDGTPTPDNPVPIQVVRGRNLLPNTATSQTVSGVTFTVNTDGSVNASGTATARIYFLVGVVTLQAGTYTMSGCPSGGSDSTYRLYDDNHTSWRDSGSGATYTADSGITSRIYITIYSGTTVSNLTFYPQLVKGSTPQPYVPYGHVGMEARSTKNLIDVNEVTFTGRSYKIDLREPIVATGKITISAVVTSTDTDASTCAVCLVYPNETTSSVLQFNRNVRSSITFNFGSSSVTIAAVQIYSSSNWIGGTNDTATWKDIQVEYGDEMTPYEPYWLYITPIPLPQRGWVAGLPDGTADSLRLDGAGKCEWTLQTSEVVLDGSESWAFNTTGGKSFAYAWLQNSADIEAQTSLSKLLVDKFVVSLAQTGETAYQGGHNLIIFTGDIYNPTSAAEAKAWAASNPITVLYPLATPVTEDCGYVDDWPTDIPEGTVVSCPELDAVGVKYFIDSAVTELARQWYARAYAELGDAVTELAGRVAALES